MRGRAEFLAEKGRISSGEGQSFLRRRAEFLEEEEGRRRRRRGYGLSCAGREGFFSRKRVLERQRRGA